MPSKTDLILRGLGLAGRAAKPLGVVGAAGLASEGLQMGEDISRGLPTSGLLGSRLLLSEGLPGAEFIQQGTFGLGDIFNEEKISNLFELQDRLGPRPETPPEVERGRRLPDVEGMSEEDKLSFEVAVLGPEEAALRRIARAKGQLDLERGPLLQGETIDLRTGLQIPRGPEPGRDIEGRSLEEVLGELSGGRTDFSGLEEAIRASAEARADAFERFRGQELTRPEGDRTGQFLSLLGGLAAGSLRGREPGEVLAGAGGAGVAALQGERARQAEEGREFERESKAFALREAELGAAIASADAQDRLALERLRADDARENFRNKVAAMVAARPVVRVDSTNGKLIIHQPLTGETKIEDILDYRQLLARASIRSALKGSSTKVQVFNDITDNPEVDPTVQAPTAVALLAATGAFPEIRDRLVEMASERYGEEWDVAKKLALGGSTDAQAKLDNLVWYEAQRWVHTLSPDQIQAAVDSYLNVPDLRGMDMTLLEAMGGR